MEKMREEFEAWCASHGYTLRPAETNCGITIDGQYGNQRVQIAWEAWQASRAAQCVELPEVRILDGGRIAEIGYELAVDDFERALDAAGIRYT